VATSAHVVIIPAFTATTSRKEWQDIGIIFFPQCKMGSFKYWVRCNIFNMTFCSKLKWGLHRINANNLHTYRCPKFHVFNLIPMHIRLSLMNEHEFVIQLESQLKNLAGYSLLDKPRRISFCISQFPLPEKEVSSHSVTHNGERRQGKARAKPHNTFLCGAWWWVIMASSPIS